jgi:hypothetical protein
MQTSFFPPNLNKPEFAGESLVKVSYVESETNL